MCRLPGQPASWLTVASALTVIWRLTWSSVLKVISFARYVTHREDWRSSGDRPDLLSWRSSVLQGTLRIVKTDGHLETDLIFCPESSIADPDPYDFGPPGFGFGSASQRYGSGPFYHQAKIVRKTLIPTVLWLLFDFLSLKNDENVRYLQKVISNKTFLTKNSFLLASWRAMVKIAGSGFESGSIPECQGSATTPKGHQFRNVRYATWKWTVIWRLTWSSVLKVFKGAVSRDVLLLVLFMNQFPPSPRVFQ